MENEVVNNYQVIVTNIKWNGKSQTIVAKKMNANDLPEQMSIDIPIGVLNEINKKPSEEANIIEQFVYNLLYKKFGREVNRCQVWLPLED